MFQGNRKPVVMVLFAATILLFALAGRSDALSPVEACRATCAERLQSMNFQQGACESYQGMRPAPKMQRVCADGQKGSFKLGCRLGCEEPSVCNRISVSHPEFKDLYQQKCGGYRLQVPRPITYRACTDGFVQGAKAACAESSDHLMSLEHDAIDGDDHEEEARKLAAERLREKERAAQEAARQAAAAEARRQEAARKEAERKEAERVAAERKEAERVAAEQEAARIAAEQEAARIAAEQEAARIAAELEAARLAAEQEAARIAAEQEAARIAAEQEAVRIAAEQQARVAAAQEAALIAAAQEAALIAAEQEATRIAAEQEAVRLAAGEAAAANAVAAKAASGSTAGTGSQAAPSDIKIDAVIPDAGVPPAADVRIG